MPHYCLNNAYTYILQLYLNLRCKVISILLFSMTVTPKRWKPNHAIQYDTDFETVWRGYLNRMLVPCELNNLKPFPITLPFMIEFLHCLAWAPPRSDKFRVNEFPFCFGADQAGRQLSPPGTWAHHLQLSSVHPRLSPYSISLHFHLSSRKLLLLFRQMQILNVFCETRFILCSSSLIFRLS